MTGTDPDRPNELLRPDEAEARLTSAAARRLIKLFMDAGGIAEEETNAVLSPWFCGVTGGRPCARILTQQQADSGAASAKEGT